VVLVTFLFKTITRVILLIHLFLTMVYVKPSFDRNIMLQKKPGNQLTDQGTYSVRRHYKIRIFNCVLSEIKNLYR